MYEKVGCVFFTADDCEFILSLQACSRTKCCTSIGALCFYHFRFPPGKPCINRVYLLPFHVFIFEIHSQSVPFALHSASSYFACEIRYGFFPALIFAVAVILEQTRSAHGQSVHSYLGQLAVYLLNRYHQLLLLHADVSIDQLDTELTNTGKAFPSCLSLSLEKQGP